MKLKFTYLYFLFMFFVGKAQEITLPTMTQYLGDSEFLISPTYAGIGNYVKIRATGVSQWLGIEDAPDYQSISSDMRIAPSSGIGFVLYNDRNGFTHQRGGRLSYAHHIILDRYKKHFVSFGLSYSLNGFYIDTNKFEHKQGVFDRAVTNNRSHWNHNFDAGFLYRYKGLFASFSVLNMLDKNQNVYGIYEPKKLRNYHIFGGYRYRESYWSSLEIEPSILFQYYESDRRSFTDINLKARWFAKEDYYWIGGSYRLLNDQVLSSLSFTAMGGIKKNIFYFAYGYQVMLNKMINYNNGTHLITIGVDLFQGIGDCECLQR